MFLRLYAAVACEARERNGQLTAHPRCTDLQHQFVLCFVIARLETVEDGYALPTFANP